MQGFRQRLQWAIENSPYKDSVQNLAIEAGLGSKTIYNMLRDERLDHSQHGPGIFGMGRIAALLGVPLDYFAPLKPFHIKRPSPDDPKEPLADHVAAVLEGQSSAARDVLSADALLRLHTKSGRRIEAFDALLDRCDQYEVPKKDDAGLRLRQIGSRSLAAITMGKARNDLLQAALDNVKSPTLKARWIEDYRTAHDRGSLTTVESLDIQMPNLPVRVKMDFIRCLLAVTDAQKRETILNYSLLIV